MLWLDLVGTAIAGSGPWVVGSDRLSVYVGTEAQRIGHLAVQTAEGERDVLEVAEGIQAFGAKAIGTVGLGNRVDLQLGIPWYRVETPRRDAPLCAALGLQACHTTQGVGVVDARVKALALDEFFGAPVSLSLGAEVRYGLFTSGTRGRVTNLGEGTLDLGPVVTVGRTGSLGKGYWSGWVEGLFRYRVPNTDQYPQLTGKSTVPGSETQASAELILGPTTGFGLGPAVTALWRPWGLDFYELDLTDPDRFGALRIANVRVGGTAVVRSKTTSLSLSYTQTVYGFNNPTDTYIVGLGLQFDGQLPGVGDG